MARKTRRRTTPLKPEEILTQWERSREVLRPYLKWLAGGAVVLVAALAIWGLVLYRQHSQEAQAQAALDRWRPQLADVTKAEETGQALARLSQDYRGTLAGEQALLFRAHLLYQTKKYPEAAKTYEELLAGLKRRDAGGLAPLVSDSLSYCYEAMGDYAKAAQVLKPVAEQMGGEYRGELLGRLALLSQQAGDLKEARHYLELQLKEPLDPNRQAQIKEKLAALEARGKAAGK